MDWIECFGIFIAIMAHSSPHKVAGLNGYQSLITSVSQNHSAGWWVTYDRRFHLKASATKNTKWSAYDVTICNHWLHHGKLPLKATPIHLCKQSCSSPFLPIPTNYRWQACLNWNDSQDGCTHSACHYDHICYRCVHKTRVTDEGHKAIDCLNKEKRMPAQWQADAILYNSALVPVRLYTLLTCSFCITY